MFIFYWPWLSLLVLLPVVIRLLSAKPKQDHNIPTIYFPALQKITNAYSNSLQNRSKKKYLKNVLLSFLWLLLVSAVMRPQLVDQLTYVNNKGYDLMLAVDISGSMRALDFSTKTEMVSRLDVTKEVVSDFAIARQGDRVGLVLFGKSAYLHSPLTLDTNSISEMLNNVVTGMAGDATAIGDAIGVGVKNLRERPENSRVIILLTDGEDTASNIPPIEAAKLAKEYGIKIYTIGVGKQGLVPFPDSRGRIVQARMNINEDLLKEISQITEGQYFSAQSKDALSQIYSQIDRLEKTEAESKEYQIRKPLFKYPLGLALCVFFILISLSFSRKRSSQEVK